MAFHSSRFLLEKFQGWRSLAGYSPQGPKDMTEATGAQAKERWGQGPGVVVVSIGLHLW